MASNSGTKDVSKPIRLTQEQWRRAVEATEIEGERLGKTVYPTVLLAEVGTVGVDRILRKAGRL